MNECTFCDIVAGEVSDHILYEDRLTIAFLDENPAIEGHTLIIPKEHVEDLLRADQTTATAVLQTARAVGAAMSETLEPDGFSTFHTTGGLVGNVEHAHLHLLPRYADDDIRIALERTRLDDYDSDRLVDLLDDQL